MTTDIVPLTVRILDREYRVTCPAGDEDALQASARQLDERMQEVKNSGKVIGIDRIAVMVALNIIHELLHDRPLAVQTEQEHLLCSRLQDLREKISRETQ